MSSVKDEKTRLKEEKKLAKEKEKLAKEEEKRLKKEQKQKDKELKTEDSPSKPSLFRISALKDINKSDRRRSTSLATPTDSYANSGFLTDRNRNSGPFTQTKLTDEETNELFEKMLDKIGASEEVKKTSRAYNMQTKQSMIRNWQSTEASTENADEQVKMLIKKVCCENLFSNL
jgi:hypothetical protein